MLASGTRDRFLRERTPLGSIRYSVGGGELSEPFALVAEPADTGKRWPGRLVVLTDPLTFSSSEDFLLGLQGLEHVTVVGRPTGGGSGRPRSLRLLPGMSLMISTALTFDRNGRCIEGAGIPVDVEAWVADDETLAVARSSLTCDDRGVERSVLVTGASSGIGLSCSTHLASGGWRVFGGVRSSEDAARLRGSRDRAARARRHRRRADSRSRRCGGA